MAALRRILMTSILATGAAAPALAETPVDLGTLTLYASTEAKGLSETGASVSVVTEDELKKNGDQSIASQLARLPGVSMTRNGGLGTSTALRLRGLSGPYIGVRIDGIDVADPSGTQCAYDFGSTTMGGISRIEVLRGSQSALYGSEAIGGVVDITTWRPTRDGTQAEVSVEAGSNGTYSGTASAGLLTDRAELAFTVSRTITDGISAYAFGTEDDGFRATTVTFSAAYDLTETLKIGLNGFWRNSYTEFDSQTADNDETEEGKLRGARVFAQFTTGTVQNELSYAHTETSRYYPLGWTQLYDGERDQVAYKGLWDANEQLSLNWGADWTDETFTGGSDTGTAATTALLGELLYAPTDTLDLSVALRRDDHETFGGKTSGRVAVAWRPQEDWVIRAVASTGFRAPSLYELYGFYGNKALTPETSTNYELGAEYLLANGGSVQATLFDTRIDDKIEWSGGTYNQVPGTTRTRGLELIGRVPVAEGWEVFGNYTYTDAFTTAASGAETPAIRVPQHDLTLGVEGQITDRLSGLFTVQHVADVWDAGLWPAPASKLPDYTVANLSVSYEVNETTSAYVRIENLFDEDYQTVRNYGQPGRSVYVGLRTSF